MSLFTYRLSGRITGADGRPVAGATVVTRTVDREDFWTFSEPSDANGNYTLPPSTRGKTVRLWQSSFQAFATFPARPGGAVDLRTWPTGLSPRVSTGTANVRLPD